MSAYEICNKLLIDRTNEETEFFNKYFLQFEFFISFGEKMPLIIQRITTKEY